MFKIKPKLSVVLDRTIEVGKSIRELPKNQVLVGIPAQNASRRESGEVSNAALGYVHNYGSPAQNIPARPFMEPGIKDKKEPVSDRMGKAAQAALDGKPDEMRKQMTAAGLAATNGIKNRIVQGPFVPLKPATIAARRRRGFAGTKPLNVTGQLRNAITFVLRKK